MKTYVQQIMLGTVTSSEAGALGALRRIKEAGYDGIELNRFMIHPSSLAVRMLTRAAGMPTGNGGKLPWREMLAETGLSVASLHTDLGSLESDPAGAAEEARQFGTDRLVITGMYRFDYSDAGSVRSLAERLNKAGTKLRGEGIALLYHNHNTELLRCGSANPADANSGSFAPGFASPGPQRAYDILIDETDPEAVNFEFDSYWFTDGGADAAWWMKRLGSRMKLWHINDRGSRQAGRAVTPILKQDSMELGTGNMDLEGLLAAARSLGVGEIILETHRGWIDKDPLKSIELSSRWLDAHARG